jgi:DNA-binding beta-propeller fold protein YncE
MLLRALLLIVAALVACAQSSAAQIADSRAAKDTIPATATPYSLYISSESADLVTRIDIDANGWRKGREISVKTVPNEIAGPHHVAVSPDGAFWYVSIAHGTPYGAVWKFATGSDSLLARVSVGMFPTTVGLSPDGNWAYVPNSDFHGDRGKINTVSALYTPTLSALSQIPTCDMPHGSRWNRAGTRVYIACMMSDELVVIDPSRFAIERRVPLGSGTPMSMAEHMKHEAGSESARSSADSGARAPKIAPKPTLGAASSTLPGQNPDCLTTYVSISPDDSVAYLACNHSNEMQVRDARTLTLRRRVPTGTGAYNVEPSPDGRLVIVSNKKAQSVSVFDARSLAELARVPTSKKVPHGIAYSPDGRYAFVTCESVGTDPGAVDAIDLATLKRVASLSLPLQPTGIAVWKRGAKDKN